MKHSLLSCSSLNRLGLTGLSLFVTSLSASVHAAPTGGQVVAGSATIAQSPGQTVIHQQSDKAVIDWRSFDIAPGEVTEFRQPGAGSTALNRVNSTQASTIDGQLRANGNVIISNPNGVIFGKSANVDVNSLLATTASIETNAFMEGSTHFDKAGNPNAKVENHGTITAKESGLVGLVAPQVENHGVINARLGRVQMASGDTAVVDLYGDGLMGVEVSDAVEQQIVRQQGQVQADGGQIQITAATGRNMLDSLIQMDGQMQAASVEQRAGKIVLSGANRIQVNGDIDASGKYNAGTIHIGGEFKGGGTTPTANHTHVTSHATLAANAAEQGDGGEIVVWGEKTAQVGGKIDATGNNGNGGMVETSGKDTLTLDKNIDVDTGGGTWLLDPTDIEIVTGGGVNKIDPGTITAGLSGGDVVINTESADGDAGHITVTDDVIYNEANSLTLLAEGDINANANIQNSGSGDVNLVAGWDGSTGFTPAFTGYDNTSSPMMGAILDRSNNAFGNGGGSVNINNAGNSVAVSVGSFDGTTTIAADDVIVRAGNDRIAHSQIGAHVDTDSGAASGAINVQALGTVDIDGSTSGLRAHAMIGHGSNNCFPAGACSDIENTDLRGDITVNADGDVTLTSHNVRGFAHIGHGGRLVKGDKSGAIEITGNNIFLSANRHEGYTQIGHGGFQSGFGSNSGDIHVAATGDLDLIAGGGSHQYAMIGHGAPSPSNNNGARSGDITVLIDGEFNMVQGGGLFAEAYIGHRSSDTPITNAALRLQAASIDYNNSDPGTFALDNADIITLIENNLVGGDVTIAATGANDLSLDSDVIIDDGDDITSSISLLSARDINMNASLQHNETDQVADGSATDAQVNLVAGWDGSTGFDDAQDATFDVAAVTADDTSYGNNSGDIDINSSGSGVQVIVGSTDGQTNLFASNIEVITGASNMDKFTQIGSVNASTGDIALYAQDTITLDSVTNSAARVGHGVNDSSTDDQQGNINVTTANLILNSSGSAGGVAKIGHGNTRATSGTASTLNLAGDITIDASGDVTINNRGSSAAVFDNYAGIGHGEDDYQDSGTRQGDIILRVGGELSLVDIDPNDAFMIGHTTATAGGMSNADVVITAAGLDEALATSGSFTLGAVELVPQLVNMLTGGDVTIASTGANDVDVTTAINIDDTSDSTGNFSLLSMRDINMNASLQHNETDQVADGSATDAQVNLVAGWDGSTGFDDAQDATFDISAITADDTSYGNNNGSVNINSAAGTLAVSAGSVDGATTVAGYDVMLRGGSDSVAHAQIGAHVETDNAAASGDITVLATNNIDINSSTTDGRAFAMIGHGSNRCLPDGSCAQIVDTDLSGDITVNADGNLTMGTDVFRAFARIGHGGRLVKGNKSGNISVSAADITLEPRAASNAAYAQIGHGGFQSGDGASTGNISVEASGDLSLLGGVNANEHAMIGHGAIGTSGNGGAREGDISVLINGELNMVQGVDGTAQAYIGHRSSNTGITNSNVRLQAASIDYDATNPGTFALDNSDIISQIKNNIVGGDVTIAATAANDLSLDSDVIIDDGDDITSSISLLSARDIHMNASLQHNETDQVADGSVTDAQVNLVAGWDGSTGFDDARDATFDVSAVTADDTSYGGSNGSVNINSTAAVQAVAVGSRDGTTTVAGHNINVVAGTTADEHAQIGSYIDDASPSDATGHISLHQNGALTITADQGFAMVGHGNVFSSDGDASDGDFRGDISINATDIDLTAGNGARYYTAIGHGGYNADGNHRGAINITGNDITLNGGSSNTNVRIGHGGHGGDGIIGDASETLSITANSVALTSSQPGENDAFAQIGHGGSGVTGSISGNILLDVAEDIVLTTNNGDNNFSAVGHANRTTTGGVEIAAITGNIALNARNITLDSSIATNNAATQIGHGGFRLDGSSNGNIAITATGDVTLQGTNAGGSDEGYALIGHSNYSEGNGDSSGNITLDVDGDIALLGGSGNGEAFAKVGHGSITNSGTPPEQGTRSGDIIVSSGGEISIVENTGPAQIGHFSRTADAVSNANIRIEAAALDFTSADTGTFNINDATFINRMKGSMEGGDVTIASNDATNLTWSSDLNVNDSDDITSSISLLSTRDIVMNASLQHSETDQVADGSATDAQVNLVAGWDGSTGFDDAQDATFDISAITADDTSYGNNNGDIDINGLGKSNAVGVGSRDGMTTLAARNITVEGAATDLYAQIGYTVTGDSDSANGDIAVHATGDVLLHSRNNFGYAMIGHGGSAETSSLNDTYTGTALSGEINVNAAGTIDVDGTGGRDAFKQIGHGGFRIQGSKSGDIDVTSGGDMEVEGSAFVNGFGAIGHGGRLSDGAMSGDINVTSGGDLLVRGKDDNGTYAMIGHGTIDEAQTSGTRNGNIVVDVSGEISMIDGIAASNAEAYIGHRTDDYTGSAGTTDIIADSLDFVTADSGTYILNSANFADMTQRNLSLGDMRIESSGTTDISLASTLENSTATSTLRVTSGGDIAVDADITNNDYDIVLQAANDMVINNEIDSNGALDISATSGTILINNDIASEGIAFNHAALLGADSAIDAGTGLLDISAGGFDADDYDIEFVAGDVDINGTITGSRSLQFETSSIAGHDMAIGDGQAGTMAFSNVELDFLDDGFIRTTFAAPNSNIINLGAYSWRDELRLVSSSGITVNGTTNVNNNRLSFASQNLNLNAPIIGSGLLTIFNTPNVGSGTASPTLTDAELSFIQDGWNQIEFINFPGDLTINTAYQFSDPTSFAAPGDNIILDGALTVVADSEASFVFEGGSTNNVIINDTISTLAGDGSGTIVLDVSGNVIANADVVTNNADITISDNVTATTLGADAALNAGQGTVSVGTGGIDAGVFALDITADELVLNGAVDGSGALGITSGDAARTINVLNGDTNGLDILAGTMAQIGTGTMFDTITIGDSTHTGTINLGSWSPASNVALRGGDVVINGNLNAATFDTSIIANTGSVAQSGGVITADTINFDAVDTIDATINAAVAVDIGTGGTRTTLEGLLAGEATQAAADTITGGPGNDGAYTFEDFVIRFDPSPTLPSVPGEPEEPVIPVTPPVSGGDDGDDNTPPDRVDNDDETRRPPTVRYPETVEQVSQGTATDTLVFNEYENSVPVDTLQNEAVIVLEGEASADSDERGSDDVNPAAITRKKRGRVIVSDQLVREYGIKRREF